MPRRTLVVLSAFICFLVLVAPASAAGNGKGKPTQRPPAKPPIVVVPRGWPKLLAMRRLGIKAPIEPIAFSKKTDYFAPYKWGDVAWYDRGPRPGDAGRANIFGHLDSYCCPAVFYPLKDARTGDLVQVTYRNGKVLNFRVMWQNTYWNDKLPEKFMFGPTREHGVVLMTCTGVFHRDGTGYDHKRVVYARLILPNGKLG